MHIIFIILLFFTDFMIGMDQESDNKKKIRPAFLAFTTKKSETRDIKDWTASFPVIINQYAPFTFTFQDIFTLKKVNSILNNMLKWEDVNFASSSGELFICLENLVHKNIPATLRIFKENLEGQLEELIRRRYIEKASQCLDDLTILNLYASRYIPKLVECNTYNDFIRKAIEDGDWLRLKSFVVARTFDIFLRYNRSYDFLSVICLLQKESEEFSTHRIFESLINKNQDQLNICSPRKDFAIHRVVEYGTKDMVEFLLQKKVDINVYDKNNRTPLCYAVMSQKEDIVKLLCKKKAIIDCDDCIERTPLHYAVIHGNLKIIRILCSKSYWIQQKNYVDFLHATDQDGNTALHYACYKKQLKILNFLLNSSLDSNKNQLFNINIKNKDLNGLLHEAVKSDSSKIVKRLLEEHNILENMLNGEKMTPIHYAADLNAIKSFKVLMCCYQVDINARDAVHWTPVFYICVGDRYKIMDYVIKRNEEIKKINKEGNNFPLFEFNVFDVNKDTPLHIAAGCGSYRTLRRLLIDNNVEINVINMEKQTALHSAILSNQYKGQDKIECVKMLLQKGICFEQSDIYGKTALEYACQLSEMEIISLLLDHYSLNFRHYDEESLFRAIESIQNKEEKNLIETIVRDKQKHTQQSYSKK